MALNHAVKHDGDLAVGRDERGRDVGKGLRAFAVEGQVDGVGSGSARLLADGDVGDGVAGHERGVSSRLKRLAGLPPHDGEHLRGI